MTFGTLDYVMKIYQLREQFSNTYSDITDYVSIGDAESDYKDFDIVVNLNFPQNGVEHGEIRKTIENGKIIYKIGLYDSVDEDIAPLLDKVIPELLEQKDKRILFHCFAGISRSVSFAIAYFGKLYGMTYQDALEMIRNERRFVNPNPKFASTLMNYLK